VGYSVGRVVKMMTEEAKSNVVRGERRWTDEHSSNMVVPLSRIML